MGFSLLVTKDNWFPCYHIKMQDAGVYFKMEPVYDDLEYWNYAASSEITIHRIKNYNLFFLLKQIKEARYFYILVNKKEDRKNIVYALMTLLPVDKTFTDRIGDQIHFKDGTFVYICDTSLENTEKNSRYIKSQHMRHWINLDSNFLYEEKT